MKYPHIPSNFESAFEFLGKRWSGLIVYTLLDGPKHFTDILAVLPRLSDRMLAERLRELQSVGVLTRKVYPERPVRIEYSLTQKGYSLQTVMAAVQEWALVWGTATLVKS
ncbi:helix-turn-helix domain-containing protein [Alicyclobacillus sp. SO9]|uniref:winged helix-turn-helix transcriptional regulator n=1 Tax=Alicyclobacillus sp. SO9 TaxID=2665646 RepID=UPI0018E6DC80|nr:helix-turn-helix domain-containing protein [Alicyclobacillus sp. SO9]QQE80635.1 helix-turn-helix transcriptional regulator [Alicyclobacillus sp. SO9]